MPRTSPLDLLAAQTSQSDAALLSSLEDGQVASASLTQSAPSTAAVPVSEDFFNASTISSSDYNTFYASTTLDLVRLFAAANDNDSRVSSLEQQGLTSLLSASTNVDRLESKIQATLDLQTGYNAGYTIYQRVDFIDNSAIETDPNIVSGVNLAQYDPTLQAVSLGLTQSRDTLHSSSGTVLANASLDLQLGPPVTAYENFRTPIHAIDHNQNSYWGEVVLSDEQIQLPWPPVGSVYNNALVAGLINSLEQGAICEYTINFEQATTWNTLTIDPFCEFPINLAAVFVTKFNPGIDSEGEVRFVQGGTTVAADNTLLAKFWSGNSSFWFPAVGGELSKPPTAVQNYGPINFQYTTSPVPSAVTNLNLQYFYARLTGWIYIPTTGVYTIGVNSDDGANLIVNNTPLVTNLATSQGPMASGYSQSGTITLSGNQWYPIVIEWQQDTGGYELQLLWTTPGTTTSNFVPAANLSSVAPAPLNTLLPVDSTIPAGYVRSHLTEYASNRTPYGALWLNDINRLSFPIQEECTAITLVFHQPHYVREIFNLPLQTGYQNSLWQQMLGNDPLLGLPQTIVSGTTTPGLDLSYTQPTDIINNLASAIGSDTSGAYTTPTTGSQSYSKYEYTYGAYDIEVFNQSYVLSSQFISTAMSATQNLFQGALIADYDLPFVSATIAASGSYFGNATAPASWSIPAATLSFDLTFGQGQPWYPVAPLDATMVHEPLRLTTESATITLRLMPGPGTPIYVTSFNGDGTATLLGGIIATSTEDESPVTITLPNVILAAPGYYVLSYTPIDTSHWVNFGDLAQSSSSVTLENFTFTGNQVDILRGITLPSEPFIDSNQIYGGFEPNGNPTSEYVPIRMAIAGMPITFPKLVTSAGTTTTISSFNKDTAHALDLYVSVQSTNASGGLYEILTSSDSTPDAATNFTAAHQNWDIRPNHLPLLFAVNAAVTTPIAAFDDLGNSVWIYNPVAGTVTFVNGNTGTIGNIALSYWYYTGTFTNPPVIVDRTDYAGRGSVAMTPFDPINYPVIEFSLLDDTIYFNVAIPSTATVTVGYNRLFDTTRVRANLDRIDPVNTSATPHLYGYTFLARDANGTSLECQTYPEVSWGNIEVYSLGPTIQLNPDLSLVGNEVSMQSSITAATSLTYVQFNWYQVTNSGSTTDEIRCNYTQANLTYVVWDLTGARYIPSDGLFSENKTWILLNTDGSNYITLQPGQSAIIGVTSLVVPPPFQVSQRSAVTLYSGQNPDFLQNDDWLELASTVTAQTSVLAVTI